MLAVLEQKQADELELFLVKQEMDHDVQKVLVDGKTAVNEKTPKSVRKR